jgi:uncharacterized membrane protein YdfJ with MMPL/SSD domain
MATYLYRLGGWSFENRRKVLFAWLLVFGVVGFCALTFSGRTSEKFDVPGTESQKAQQLLEHKFPEASGAYARVVYEAPAGEKLTDPENRKPVMASVTMARKAKDVMRVIDPFTAHAFSPDGRIGYTDVIYPVPSDRIDHSAREELAAVAGPARDAGLTVEFGGRLVTNDKSSNSESVGLMLGYAVLAITLASLLAAGMPLLTAILGVAIGIAGLTALTGVIEMSDVAPTLATMLGLAVGIDYALFILSRHRQNVADGLELRESAAQATATAGSAVVFAGLTVIIALTGLTVINIPFLTVMGLAAAATVAIAVLIALTLLPALLGFAGGRVIRVNRVLAHRPKRNRERGDTVSVRWARFVTEYRLPVLLAGLALLGSIALPALHMKLGLPDDGSWPTSTTERRAYDLLGKGFGPGFNGPLTIVVDAPNSSVDRQHEIATAVSHGLGELPGVAAVSPPMHNQAGDVTVVSVTPTGSPASGATNDLVSLIREKADQIPDAENIHGYVTGTTALNIDTSDRLSAALPSYIAVVVGLALLLLAIVFRSIWVPIKAAAGFLLSIASSMGIVVWIFQDGHIAGLFDVAQTGPVVSFLPVLLIAILFGLAMDYEVFLVSRMRESFVHTGNARDSIVTGFGQSGRVVTAAALIMTGVFAAFVLDIDPVVKSIALSLACGVLLDAFVVRMTLVPAVMAMLGKNAWWLPHRLDRRLPDVDIEGARLLTHLGEPARP